MELIIITFIVIGVIGVADQYLKEKRRRERTMKEIGRKIELRKKNKKNK